MDRHAGTPNKPTTKVTSVSVLHSVVLNYSIHFIVLNYSVHSVVLNYSVHSVVAVLNECQGRGRGGGADMGNDGSVL